MQSSNELLEELLLLAPAKQQKKLLKKLKRAYLESHLADHQEDRIATLMLLKAVKNLFK